jgi:hypothetical protein
MSYLRSGRGFLSWSLLFGNASRLATLGSSRLLWAPLRASIGFSTLLGRGSRWLGEGWEDPRAGVSYTLMFS